MNQFRTVAGPLMQPDFARLWSGLTVTRLGDQFATIALLWFVLQLTGSGAAVGLVILCFDLPALVTGPLLGQLLDRYPPRLIMGLDNTARAVIIGAMPVLYWLHWLQLGHILALALLAGALAPATLVGVRTLLPQIVPDADLDHANTLSAASLQFVSFVGPAVAGYLVAMLGGPAVLLLDSVSFIVMAVVAFSLPEVKRLVQSGRTRVRTWLGFGPLLALRDVRALTVIAVVFFFAYGPLEPALPLYSRDVLAAGASGFGLLWSGYGVGALAGLFGVKVLSARKHPGVILAVIAILWGIFLLPLVVLKSLPAAMFFFAVAGAAWAPYSVIEMTLLQRLVPADIRGQVFGARATLTSTASPLGSAVGGFLLDYLCAPVVIGLSAAGCIVAGIMGLVSPTLRNVQRVAASDQRDDEAMQSGAARGDTLTHRS